MNIDWNSLITNVIAVIGGGVLTVLGQKVTTRGNIQSKEVEVKPTSDKVNLEHTTKLFEEYRGQVESYKKRVDELESSDRDRQRKYEKMQDDYAAVLQKVSELQEEVRRIKQSSDHEIEGYKNTIIQKNERIDDLKMEIEELKDENERLKEELHGTHN